MELFTGVIGYIKEEERSSVIFSICYFKGKFITYGDNIYSL